MTTRRMPRRNPTIKTLERGLSAWRLALNKYAEIAGNDPYHLYGISFTNAIDDRGRIKLGVYPASKSHDDPKGVFAYPVGYTVDISYGKSMKAWAIIRIPIPARIQNAIVISDTELEQRIADVDVHAGEHVMRILGGSTPRSDLLALAQRNGWGDWARAAVSDNLDDIVSYMPTTLDSMRGHDVPRPVAGKWYHAAKALTNDKYLAFGRYVDEPDDELADRAEEYGYKRMKWGSSLRGVPYVYDIGTGSIHHAEPAQFIVLDATIMEVMDYGTTAKREIKITPIQYAALGGEPWADRFEAATQHLINISAPHIYEAYEAGILAKTVGKLVLGEAATVGGYRNMLAPVLAAMLGVSETLTLRAHRSASTVFAELMDTNEGTSRYLAAKRAHPEVVKHIVNASYSLLTDDLSRDGILGYVFERAANNVVTVSTTKWVEGVGSVNTPIIKRFSYSTGKVIP